MIQLPGGRAGVGDAAPAWTSGSLFTLEHPQRVDHAQGRQFLPHLPPYSSRVRSAAVVRGDGGHHQNSM